MVVRGYGHALITAMRRTLVVVASVRSTSEPNHDGVSYYHAALDSDNGL